jgi:hypothetical protein
VGTAAALEAASTAVSARLGPRAQGAVLHRRCPPSVQLVAESFVAFINGLTIIAQKGNFHFNYKYCKLQNLILLCPSLPTVSGRIPR